MESAPPGYAQQVFVTPHAAHGQLLHEGDAKKAVQLPCTQTSFALQLLPHWPQLTGLLASSTCVRQAPLQNCCPSAPQVVTWHVPSTQRSPLPRSQVTPQPPQLAASLVTSTQAPPHLVSPGRHAQVPLVQA